VAQREENMKKLVDQEGCWLTDRGDRRIKPNGAGVEPEADVLLVDRPSGLSARLVQHDGACHRIGGTLA
jgi:hypothetical protein